MPPTANNYAYIIILLNYFFSNLDANCFKVSLSQHFASVTLINAYI